MLILNDRRLIFNTRANLSELILALDLDVDEQRRGPGELFQVSPEVNTNMPALDQPKQHPPWSARGCLPSHIISNYIHVSLVTESELVCGDGYR